MGGESQDDFLKRRNIELDKALRLEPHNVPLWLEFATFQDEVALAAYSSYVGESTKRSLNKTERTSTSEIKMSILARALSFSANAAAEPLLLAQLRAAAEVEEATVVLARWKETLRTHPTLTGLWIEYVSWRQSNSVNFGVREVVEVFVECFEVLKRSMDKEREGSSG